MIGRNRDQLNDSNAVVVVVAVVVRAVVASVVMACLFGCFKIKDVTLPSTPGSNSELNRVSQSTPAKEPLVSGNRSPLSSLFTEENDEINTLGCKEVENQSSDTPNELQNQISNLNCKRKIVLREVLSCEETKALNVKRFNRVCSPQFTSYLRLTQTG